MELKAFIRETLNQIIDGVKESQSYAIDSGAKVNPILKNTVASGDNYFFYSDSYENEDSYLVLMVGFDVSVTVTESDKEKAGIGVFSGVLGVGAQGQLEGSTSHANKIKFIVPIMLPAQK